MTDKQPIYIMPENVERTMGRDAQRNNILAAKLVADSVKTTLGPKGMDKMLVDSSGNIIITNDGVTILEEMDLEHPAAKMMVDIAKTQENEVGDGTTTAVILAGKLLENAEKLLDKKVHPTVITKGYKLAEEQAKKILRELAIDSTNNQEQILRNIARTAMTGKGAETSKEKLSGIIVEAIAQIGEKTKQGVEVDLNNIKIEKAKGDSIEESQLIKGIVLDKERTNIEMPSYVENAKIALVDFAIEVRNPEGETKLSIDNPDQLQGFIEREDIILRELTNRIKQSNANVVFCQKGIDDVAQYYLAKYKIYACRRVARSDMEKLARATNAKIISSIHDLTESELGRAKIVREVKQGEEKMTYIEGCENPRAITILIKGGSSHVLDEVERAIKDGLGDVASVLKSGKIVAGGGAVEIELSRRLRLYAGSLSGRERLAVEEFANALESIPEALAENAGLDPIDILTELKARHENNEVNVGVNILNNKIEDCLKAGIIEPLKIKTQAISSASEVSMMILRIDDVLSASGKNSSKHMRNMPGMGEYE